MAQKATRPGGGDGGEQYSATETAQRLDRALKRSLTMPSKASKKGQESPSVSRRPDDKKQSRSKA